MAYTKFTEGKPVIAPDTGAQVVTYTRDNIAAVRDGVLFGVMPDWELQTIVAPAEWPTSLKWKKKAANLWLRATIAYGTSGATQDYVTSIVCEASGDNSVWDPIGTYTLTYDGSGYLVSGTWS